MTEEEKAGSQAGLSKVKMSTLLSGCTMFILFLLMPLGSARAQAGNTFFNIYAPSALASGASNVPLSFYGSGGA